MQCGFLRLWEHRPQSRSWICTRTHLGTPASVRAGRPQAGNEVQRGWAWPWVPGVFFIVKPNLQPRGPSGPPALAVFNARSIWAFFPLSRGEILKDQERLDLLN